MRSLLNSAVLAYAVDPKNNLEIDMRIQATPIAEPEQPPIVVIPKDLSSKKYANQKYRYTSSPHGFARSRAKRKNERKTHQAQRRRS
jgi:hypothetical protein